jgi:hypothetical protein
MKVTVHGHKVVLAVALATFMSGCGHNPPKVQEHYTAFVPDDALLQDYVVPQPPLASKDYSILTSDEKESFWTDYTNDLLQVIGKHMADKAGLRKAKSDFIEKTDKLNKEAGTNK